MTQMRIDTSTETLKKVRLATRSASSAVSTDAAERRRRTKGAGRSTLSVRLLSPLLNRGRMELAPSLASSVSLASRCLRL